MDEQNRASGLGTTDYFAESLLHESIRESGNPYRFTANGYGINRIQQADQKTVMRADRDIKDEGESDILSVYNSL